MFYEEEGIALTLFSVKLRPVVPGTHASVVIVLCQQVVDTDERRGLNKIFEPDILVVLSEYQGTKGMRIRFGQPLH